MALRNVEAFGVLTAGMVVQKSLGEGATVGVCHNFYAYSE
jgi:hypothetical protein